MAVYRIRKDSLFLTELPMYGEKRLGVIKENRFLMKKPTQNGMAIEMRIAAGGERIARKGGGPPGTETGSRRQEDRRAMMPGVWPPTADYERTAVKPPLSNKKY
ncbi:MAG: hypothetical protein KatS3mg034_1167 [Vicingaceae bacterium]|nr:MAG: hypothetical protein KatS3mg034_1167 [Vicingaceae bacterium]